MVVRAVLIALLPAACAFAGRPVTTFACAPAGHESVESMLLFARDNAAATDSSGAAFRAEHGITGGAVAEWQRQVFVVQDKSKCEQAGRAYADEQPMRAGVHDIALVAVGQRYNAIDVTETRRAGEFTILAVLDREFRVIVMLAT